MPLTEDRTAGFGLPRPRPRAPGDVPPGSGLRPGAARGGRRLLLGAAGLAVLGAVLVRVSLRVGMDADAANKALQGWDLLHGHLLLGDWITGDATFYTLESPLFALVEAVTGLGPAAAHVVPALIYVLLLAVVGRLGAGAATGWAARLRATAGAAVLCLPLAAPYGVGLLLEQPDHIGTSLYPLAAFALIERSLRGRMRPWAAAAGVFVLCSLGILGDDTVTYVAVPSIVLVCGARAVATRRWFGSDAGFALAAVGAVPAERLLRLAMHALDSYWMTRPATEIAPPRLWAEHVARTADAVAALFGAAHDASPLCAALGAGALAAAAFGFVRALWFARRPRTADTLESLAAVGIVASLAVYTLSTGSTPVPAHEIAMVLPLGALLAARAVCPAWTWWPAGARRMCALLAAAALAAVAGSAVRPDSGPIPTAPARSLAAWLAAHGLREGIAGYFDASTLTVDSGGRVEVRAVVPARGRLAMYAWETRTDWYDPTRHDASFAVAYDERTSVPEDELDRITTSAYEAVLGRPTALYRVDGRSVLVYSMNLYRHVAVRLPVLRKRE